MGTDKFDPQQVFVVNSITRAEVAEEFNNIIECRNLEMTDFSADDLRLSDKVCQRFADRLFEAWSEADDVVEIAFELHLDLLNDLEEEAVECENTPTECKVTEERGTTDPLEATKTMRTNEIIGFRVMHPSNEMFLAADQGGNYLTSNETTPIARGDAFRRLAAHLDDHPEVDACEFSVEPVYRETTPIEEAASELGGLFESLCSRHGLNLGLSRDQINALLVKDLETVKNLGFVTGIPGLRR